MRLHRGVQLKLHRNKNRHINDDYNHLLGELYEQ